MKLVIRTRTRFSLISAFGDFLDSMKTKISYIVRLRKEATRRGAIVTGAAVLALGVPSESPRAEDSVLTHTLNDPTITTGDAFGSVALDGNLLLIGAYADDTNGTDVGQAHLFDATTGALLRTFDDPTVTSHDVFGFTVAIDGDLVLIGAPNHGSTGQAHLFDANTGALLRTFDGPTPTSADQFGIRVALDGNRALIGDARDNTNGSLVGRAHLFDTSTGAILRTFDDPTVTGADEFGGSVALDGNSVLIGAKHDATNGFRVGQAYLFDATTGALLWTFDDPTPTSSDLFGESVAIDGNRVLVGAPHDDSNGTDVGQAYLFDASTGALLQTFDDPTVTLTDSFGVFVALDGDRALIGATFDDTGGTNVGQAYLFDANTGALLQTFDDPTPTIGDTFGSWVALDGDRVLIGAAHDDTNGTNVGQAYLFTTIPDAPLAAVESLIQTVLSLNLANGISNSLDAKLNSVINALDDMNENNDVAAINSLNAFINAVEAQRGNEIPEADACNLIQAADEIIVALGGISSSSTCLI